MLFSDFICFPLPHTSTYMLTQTPRCRSSVCCTSLAVSSFGLKKCWRTAVALKCLYQALRAVKDTQCHLPVDAPEKFDSEIFWSWLVPLYMLGQCPSPCTLYPDLSYREAPTEMTDNIIFLRTSVRCYSPLRFAGVFMCLVLLQVGWFIMLIVVSVFLIGC